MYQNYMKLRDERNLSDYAVAKNTGIPQSTFTDWKTGRSAPKMEKLIKIADFLGVSIDALVREET
jgi:transcriptional regulator with XRE-family HTH domain